MRDIIHDILYKYWGYESFREQQEEIILSVLAGKDTLGLLPTGGGKSLTFQVPGLAMDGITLVITPLIALMKDQVDNLRERGIKARCIHSGMRRGEIRNIIDHCLYGKCKFLYVSPERLTSQTFLDSLRQMDISLIAVDEAHCISQWGYDFRPSYLNISAIRALFPDAPVLALTASATQEVVEDIMHKLQFRHRNIFRKSFRRDNLSYIVRRHENKTDKLLSVMERTHGSCIIYVRSRRKTALVAKELSEMGYPADFYHAGLSTEEKRDKQDRWKSGERRIMVATNAFGMGIDKPDVRLVVHLDVPNSLEEYYQEAGRAGRDGKQSYALLIAGPKDVATLRRRIAEAYPPKDFIMTVYERACDFLEIPIGGGFDQMFDFNFQLFCTTFKLPEVQTLSALKILTASRLIDYIDEVETQSRILILAEKEDLYNIPGMTPEMDNVLVTILRNYTGFFSEYVAIDEASLSYRYHIPQQLIYETLLFLNRNHLLHYIPRKRTSYIYFPQSREELKHAVITREAYEEGKQRLERRILSMIDYVENTTDCREKKMLSYFGEQNTTDCNRCDVCKEYKKKKSSFNKELFNSIQYMVSLKPCSAADFLDTLSQPKDEIIGMLRFMSDEGFITFADGLFRQK